VAQTLPTNLSMDAEHVGQAADLAKLQSELTAAPTWAAVRKAAIASLGAPPGEALLRGRVLAQEIEDAVITLLNRADKPGEFSLELETYYLPAVFERWAYAPRRREYWELQRERFRLQVRSTKEPKERGVHMLQLLLCDAVLSGIGPALRAFFDNLIDYDPRTMLQNLPLPLAELGRAFQRCGWHRGNIEVLVDSMVPRGLRSQDHLAIAWTGMFGGALFLAPDFADALMDLVFERLVLPVLHIAADNGQLSFASAMETHIYGSYLRRHESEARFSRIYAEIGPLLARCGRKFASSSPAPESSDRLYEGPPRVAFVIQNPTLLAHSATLLTFLRGLHSVERPSIVPVVMFLNGHASTPAMLRALSNLGVGYFIAESQDHHPLVELKTLVARQRIVAAIFVSLPFNLSLAAGMRLAPVVIWWSMKYHRFSLPDIDGYMTAGAFFEDFREIDGRTWRSCRTALPPLTDPHLAASVAEAKNTLGLDRKALVLGCIGRDEKMLGDGYLEAVAAILKACENTMFIWTGRAQVRAPDVQRKLELLGVAARCKFLGWVPNTKIVAQMLDVYLDSFPFASGHTGFEAMAIGVPMVVLATGQAVDSSTLTSLVPVLRGRTGTSAEQAEVRSIFADAGREKLIPYVETIDEYVARGIALVRDAALRRRVGDAGRRFVERFARDEKAFAVSTCRHILDIIAETRAANVSGHAANV